ncbi:MAG TPA: GTPase Era [Anaerolineales bacterium]
MTEKKSGFISIIGRPNVGKSTLVNAFLGQKIAAVTPKAQTTRRRQMGILTMNAYQLVFLDTPGIHNPHHKLGEFLNQEAVDAIQNVDCILWLVDASVEPTDEDQRIAAILAQKKKRAPLVLALNKIDMLEPDQVPARLDLYSALVTNAEVFALSATRGEGRNELLETLIAKMPVREPEFDEEQVTDFYEREIAAELIREACLIHLRNEVPHGVNVRIDEFTERGEKGAHIGATVFVERESQKGIIIGEGAAMLKKIGITARQEIEAMSGRKVFLELRVKVEKDWRDDESAMRRFGYKLEPKKKK